MSKLIVTTVEASGATLTLNDNTTVNGTLTATNVNTSSDVALKHDIVTIPSASDMLAALRGVNFEWNHNNEKSMGVVAQEVEEVIPEIVATDINGHKAVNYQAITGLLIEAVKDLQNQVKALTK
jgi:hypothetical protein